MCNCCDRQRFTCLLNFVQWSTVLLQKLTGSAASQEIRHIFGIPRFITVLAGGRPVPILSQLHPVLTSPFQFLKTHLNVILSYASGPPPWPLSLWFLHQNPVHPSQYAPHSPPISCFSILPPAQYSVRITNH